MRGWGPVVGTLLLAACVAPGPLPARTPATIDDRVARVEAALVPAITIRGAPRVDRSLAARLAHHRVPAVSVAVINGSQLVWTKAYGVVEARGAAATRETLFQAGSISKTVAAMTALRLVETARLGLDEDVRARIRSWRVPDGEFGADAPVTLRGLLSHTAGFNVRGFPGYEPGSELPTLSDILNGRPPCNTPPIRLERRPGTEWRYSGGGYTVLQQLVTDVGGRGFPELAKQLVLDPLAMTQSTFAQPLPPAPASRAATGTYRSGESVKGRWHLYPEQAAAGLWTTPTDLAQVVIELQSGGRVLSAATVRTMLTPVRADYALGLEISGAGDTRRFQHRGKNEGFQALLVGDASGRGAVVMANSENGLVLAGEIVRAIAREFAWSDYPQGQVRDAMRLSPERLTRYAGSYEATDEKLEIAVQGDGLELFDPARPNERVGLHAASERSFFALDDTLSIEFVIEGDEVTGFRIGEGPRALLLRRRTR